MTTNKKIGLWTLAVAICLLLFISFGLPQIGKYYAQRWLVEQGAAQAEIASIRFNPFMGRVTIEGVSVHFPDSDPVSIGHFATEIQWRSLWSKRIHFKSVALDNASTPLSVSSQEVRLGELQLWQAAEQPAVQEAVEDTTTPWQVQVDGLHLSAWRLPLHLYDTDTDINIDSLELSQLDTGAADQPATIVFSGQVNEDPVNWSTEVTPFAEQPVIAGHLQFQQVDLSKFAALMGQNLAELRGILDADTDLRVVIQKQGVGITQQGQLSLTDFLLPDLFQSQAVNWSGKSQLTLTLDDSIGSLDLTGDITSQGLQPVLEGMQVSLDQARWSGELVMPTLNDVNTLSTTAGLVVDGLAVSDGTNNQSIAQCQLQNIQVASDMNVSIESLRMGDVALSNSRQPDSAMTAQQMRVTGLRYLQSEGVRINDYQVTDLKLSLVRDQQGNWQLPYAAAPSESKSETADGGKPMAVVLGQFQLTGNNKIVLDDRSVTPAAVNTVVIDQMQVRDIATASPDVWSTFQVAMRQGQYGKLELDGKFRQPGPDMDLQMTAAIDQLDLPPWSSYLASATGYQVQHGVLDSTLDASVEKGVLDAQTEFRLQNLAVERADDERAQQMEASMSMPLDSALSMLRDKDNNIKLKIPVTGNLRSPDFDISDAMNQAIATALKKTTMTYLKYALQPYGALLMLGEAVGSKAGQVGFTPVEFVAMQAEMTPDAMEYMGKIGELLNQRPEMRLKMCGIATSQDLTEEQRKEMQAQETEKPQLNEEVKTAMLELASRRAATAKQFIVEKYGIDSARLFTCLPKIELTPEAMPRVELGL